MMRARNFFYIITIFCLVAGCTPAVSFKVLDEQTGAPISGAVAQADWVTSSNRYYYSSRVIEKVTDNEGIFTIPRYFGTFGVMPRIKVYKPGYTGWHNQYIYLGHTQKSKGATIIKRIGFKYRSQSIYLEPWPEGDPEYLHDTHLSFLSITEPSGYEYNQLFEEQVEKHEEPLATFEKK